MLCMEEKLMVHLLLGTKNISSTFLYNYFLFALFVSHWCSSLNPSTSMLSIRKKHFTDNNLWLREVVASVPLKMKTKKTKDFYLPVQTKSLMTPGTSPLFMMLPTRKSTNSESSLSIRWSRPLNSYLVVSLTQLPTLGCGPWV